MTSNWQLALKLAWSLSARPGRPAIGGAAFVSLLLRRCPALIGLGVRGGEIEPARAGWGEAWNRRAPVKVPTGRPPPPLGAPLSERPGPPQPPSRSRTAFAAGAFALGAGSVKKCPHWGLRDVRARQGRPVAGTCRTRGDVTEAGLWRERCATASSASPIVPLGLRRPSSPLAVTAKVSGWLEPD